jgi:hypothetical protein
VNDLEKIKLDEIVKRGLDAEARIQKTIKLIEALLKTIELSPETDGWGLQPARERMKEVEGYLIDLIFDAGWTRDSLIEMDEAARGYSASYDQVHDSVPAAYQRGRQDAIHSLHAGLDYETQQALRFAAREFAALSDEERHAQRLRMYASFEREE